MKLYQIYFSPTGGTKKVADILAKSWKEEKEEIDLSDKTIDFSSYDFKEEDLCLIAVPSFGGRVPDIVLSRLKVMSGGKAKAILTVVYGNRAIDDTLLELKKAVLASNFSCIAAVEAVAEHSIMHQFGTGRPDSQDEKELVSFADKIKVSLEQGTINMDLAVPGNRPYREYNGVPFKPTGGKKCTKCGLCAEKCPVNAIPSDNPADVDKALCISCMRCVSICPCNARALNKVMLFAASTKMSQACSGRKENKLYL